MKKSLFSLLLILSAACYAQAQKIEAAPVSPAASEAAFNDSEVRKTTDALAAKYSLTADQAKQMYTVQARKARNLAQIESLKDTDPALYYAKVQNVQKSTLSGIRRILNNKDQVTLYQKTQSEIRVARSKMQKELTAKKASPLEINAALTSIYAE